MKIFALTNDNHMVKNLPDYCCQVYAGELDIRIWGYLSALYEVINARLEDDVVGITVDDRLFIIKGDGVVPIERVFKKTLSEIDVITEPKITFGESVSSQFSKCHMPSCLFYAYEAICNVYPQYEDAFLEVMDNNILHLHNTFITKNGIFYDYMRWLFDILFFVEKNISCPVQDFILASLPERLLEVYIRYNGLSIKEVPCTKIR